MHQSAIEESVFIQVCRWFAEQCVKGFPCFCPSFVLEVSSGDTDFESSGGLIIRVGSDEGLIVLNRIFIIARCSLVGRSKTNGSFGVFMVFLAKNSSYNCEAVP